MKALLLFVVLVSTAWAQFVVTNDVVLDANFAMSARIGAPNTFTGAQTFLTSVTSPHLISSGSAPAIAAGAGAGTSPTVSIAGTDTAGAITVTSGTLPSVSAAIVTITFATAYGAGPRVVLWPANASASVLSFLPYVTSTTSTFVVNASTVALGGATTYVYNYLVIQ